jgi:lariat debranching enzyme
VELSYDLEWLAILYLTNGLVNYQSYNTRLPQNYEATRWSFTPTEEEKQAISKKFEGT